MFLTNKVLGCGGKETVSKQPPNATFLSGNGIFYGTGLRFTPENSVKLSRLIKSRFNLGFSYPNCSFFSLQCG